MWHNSWQRVLTKAEKIVGYPSSFLNLRYLLSDELSSVILQTRKLVGSKHPFIKTVKNMMVDGKGLGQSRGLVVLLLSRLILNQRSSPNNSPGIKPLLDSSSPQIHNFTCGQKSLAEIAETVHAAMTFHRGIVNLDIDSGDKEMIADLEYGNKMTLLFGDFLLASVSTSLGRLHDTNIVEDVSEGISQTVEAEFTKFAQSHNCPAEQQSADSLTIDSWRQYIQLSRASILSRCSRAAAKLGGASEETQALVAQFSEYWTYLYYLSEESSLEQPGRDNDRYLSIIFPDKCASSEQSRQLILNYQTLARSVLAELPQDDEAVGVLNEMLDVLSSK